MAPRTRTDSLFYVFTRGRDRVLDGPSPCPPLLVHAYNKAPAEARAGGSFRNCLV